MSGAEVRGGRTTRIHISGISGLGCSSSSTPAVDSTTSEIFIFDPFLCRRGRDRLLVIPKDFIRRVEVDARRGLLHGNKPIRSYSLYLSRSGAPVSKKRSERRIGETVDYQV